MKDLGGIAAGLGTVVCVVAMLIAGRLGANGRAYAEIRTGPIPDPSAVGVVFYHAFVVYDAPDVFHMASNTVALRIAR